ncbi:MAG: OadG family protein [Treponema sp.]|nr:OadG family protein [Treponema sp.]
MTIMDMLQQSAILTLLGMAVVFVFLWVMIVCVNWIGKLVHSLGLDKDVQPKNEAPKNPDGAVSPQTAAAISAAVTEYRKKEHG